MENLDLKTSCLHEILPADARLINGGVFWKAMAIISAAIYIYDHWECIKAGINEELQE
jgi:hypothetical protein